MSALKRACAGDVVDHAMSAWRVPKRGTGRGEEKRKPAARKKPMTETFFDDDGKRAAARGPSAELNALDAVGVACVVTRAYGGINLGKKRFEHIRERVSKLVSRESRTRDARVLGRVPRRGPRPRAGAAGAPRSGTVSRRRWAARQVGTGCGGPEESASRRTDASAIDISRGGAASAGVSAQSFFSRKRGKEGKKTIPRSVADDIRARLAEAAEPTATRKTRNAKRETRDRRRDKPLRRRRTDCETSERRVRYVEYDA